MLILQFTNRRLEQIRAEALALEEGFRVKGDSENLTESGSWTKHQFYVRGKAQPSTADLLSRCPVTAQVRAISNYESALRCNPESAN